MRKNRKRINIVSLGCSKNLVDSERLMKMLDDAGYDVVFESDEDCNICVVNTCGFISDAKEQSIREILKWAELRSNGELEKLIVMGCLSERYMSELPGEIPEVDKWIGKLNWNEVVEYLTSKSVQPTFHRVLTTPAHSAYIKVAEGCNRFCAFCAIPLITGRYKSRTIEDICNEVKYLTKQGVKEFNIIAQDLSYYGTDLYGKQEIARLVEEISGIEGVEWIRLHYLYPNDFPLDLLDVIREKPNVCKYIDIALQHVADPVLENMRRHITGAETKALLKSIRERVPGIFIRTTLMVGFPGERRKEFDELVEFVKEQKFERMGAFAYCEEEDTYAAKNFKDNVPDKEKRDRLNKLMAIQEEISQDVQSQFVGKELMVVIDHEEGDYFVCRSQYDSPDVDPEILVKKDDNHRVGEFHEVTITEAMPFELIGIF